MEVTGSRELADYGAAGDFETLGRFIRSFSTDAACDLGMSQAEKGDPTLIRKHKAGIQRVAAQLLRKRKLSGNEVDVLAEREKVFAPDS